MRKFLLPFITGFLLFCLIPSCARADPDKNKSPQDFAALFRSIGMMSMGQQKIPRFEVSALDGTIVNPESLKGKMVFLNFWATWCPPCRAEMPSIQRLYEHFKDTDFTILAVSVGEDAKTVRDFLAEGSYSFPAALNVSGSLASVFTGRGIPTTYILNKNGDVIAARIGAQEWDTPEIIAAFTKLLESGI